MLFRNEIRNETRAAKISKTSKFHRSFRYWSKILRISKNFDEILKNFDQFRRVSKFRPLISKFSKRNLSKFRFEFCFVSFRKPIETNPRPKFRNILLLSLSTVHPLSSTAVIESLLIPEKNPGELRIEPGLPGREAWTLPLCYGDTPCGWIYLLDLQFVDFACRYLQLF